MHLCWLILPWLIGGFFLYDGLCARRDRKELEKIGDALERMIALCKKEEPQ